MNDVTILMIVWIGVIAITLIAEALTSNLVTVWFGLAGIPALILEFLGFSFLTQLITFLVVSIILLLTTKPIVVKLTKGKTIKTNYERIIGSKAIALEDFGALKNGYVKVDGMEWLAVSEEEISKNDTVIVKSVSGAKVKVSKI